MLNKCRLIKKKIWYLFERKNGHSWKSRNDALWVPKPGKKQQGNVSFVCVFSSSCHSARHLADRLFHLPSWVHLSAFNLRCLVPVCHELCSWPLFYVYSLNLYAHIHTHHLYILNIQNTFHFDLDFLIGKKKSWFLFFMISVIIINVTIYAMLLSNNDPGFY